MPRGDKPTTTRTALRWGWIYEDELPDAFKHYSDWYDDSIVLDGVRMGPPVSVYEKDVDTNLKGEL